MAKAEEKQGADAKGASGKEGGEGDSSFMDWVHGGLDAAGLWPGVGIVPDLLNAGIYGIEGDGKNALWSLGGAVPVLGQAVTGAKWAKKGVDAADIVLDGAKAMDRAKDGARIADGAQGAGRKPLQTGAGAADPTKLADEAYDAIRANKADVAAIARNTGYKPESIQKVKDHLFHNEHKLDRYVDLGVPATIQRFDSNIDIANAWKRLENGTHTAQDIKLLKHETAEAWHMRTHGSGYSAAHDAAQKRYPSGLE